jgi:hypothetical protein
MLNECQAKSMVFKEKSPMIFLGFGKKSWDGSQFYNGRKELMTPFF